MDPYQNQQSEIFSDLPPPVFYASFLRRLAAWIIDLLILSLPVYFINRMMGYEETSNFYSEGGTLGYRFTNQNPVSLILQWLYFALQESSPAGATLGKRAMGIAVTDTDGERIGFGKATGRYFGKIISFILLCIGFLMVLWDDRRQGLHDKMAGTLVVRK